MVAYFCSASEELVENHHPEDCVLCLRNMRNAWKAECNLDHIQQIRNLSYRVKEQRKELARLNWSPDEQGAAGPFHRGAATIIGLVLMAQAIKDFSSGKT
jgi:hypothetical protein